MASAGLPRRYRARWLFANLEIDYTQFNKTPEHIRHIDMSLQIDSDARIESDVEYEDFVSREVSPEYSEIMPDEDEEQEDGMEVNINELGNLEGKEKSKYQPEKAEEKLERERQKWLQRQALQKQQKEAPTRNLATSAMQNHKQVMQDLAQHARNIVQHMQHKIRSGSSPSVPLAPQDRPPVPSFPPNQLFPPTTISLNSSRPLPWALSSQSPLPGSLETLHRRTVPWDMSKSNPPPTIPQKLPTQNPIKNRPRPRSSVPSAKSQKHPSTVKSSGQSQETSKPQARKPTKLPQLPIPEDPIKWEYLPPPAMFDGFCVLCERIHTYGQCPLRNVKVDRCPGCGYHHFHSRRLCPLLQSLETVEEVRNRLRDSTEDRAIVRAASNYLSGVRADYQLRERSAKEAAVIPAKGKRAIP